MLRRLLARFDGRARLPDGYRVYAFGDIHGCADLLRAAFQSVDQDLARGKPRHVIQVFLGDYVDRGPDSRATVDLLVDRSRHHEAIFVRGNHEAMLTDVLRDPLRLAEWLELGAMTTLLSYGIVMSPEQLLTNKHLVSRALANALPKAHANFLSNLVPSFVCGDFFFAHAGVRPGIALDHQSEEDLMWIREPFLSCEEDFGKVVVHGHSPVRDPEIRSNRVNIDTGAYATGSLTVLSIEDFRLNFLFGKRS